MVWRLKQTPFPNERWGIFLLTNGKLAIIGGQMKKRKSHLTILATITILVLLISGCSGLSRQLRVNKEGIRIEYKVQKEDIKPLLFPINIVIIDERLNKDITEESTKIKIPVAEEFLKAFSERLSKNSVKLIDVSGGIYYSLAVYIRNFRLDFRFATWTGEVGYVARVSEGGNLIYEQEVSETAKKFNKYGFGSAEEAISEAFNLAINRFDPNKIKESEEKKVVLIERGPETKETVPQDLIISQRNEDPISLPREMEKIFQGVVIIRAGSGLASGFLVSKDGYILTAAHVVSGMESISVQLRSGKLLEGQVLRVDEDQDIALLKIPGQGYPSLPLAISDYPSVGSEVYAVGAPLVEVLSFSVTKGIISGLRKIGNYIFIQTDASINPGNSGGPLINTTGNVVGIVSWKIVETGLEGLAFGVPMKVVSDRLGIQW